MDLLQDNILEKSATPQNHTSVEHELSKLDDIKLKGSSWKRLIFHLSRWKTIDMLQDVAGSQKKILSVLAVCFLFLPMSVFFLKSAAIELQSQVNFLGPRTSRPQGFGWVALLFRLEV